jgi:hypothetical protein
MTLVCAFMYSLQRLFLLTIRKQTLLLILSIIVIAFAAYIVCVPYDLLPITMNDVRNFFDDCCRYIVDSYKDQLNQNVVGDISFGR